MSVSCKVQEVNTEFENLDNWHFKSFDKDSVAGISMDKTFEYLKNKKGREVIIAVIDSDVDINHNDIKRLVWHNPDEIVNNDIDDDNNGYIDDIHGWNFTRNKKGERVMYTTNSQIEIINYYDSKFKNKALKEVGKDSIEFKIYQNALNTYKKDQEKIELYKGYYEKMIDWFPKAKKEMFTIFKKNDYSIAELDSVVTVFEKIKNDSLADYAYLLYQYKKNNLAGTFEKGLEDTKQQKLKSNNLKYNDRLLLGDDVYDLKDKNYGSNIVNSNLDKLSHGTTVSGVIALLNKNRKTNIKILFLPLFTKAGAEKDKDLALAIKYAVDNGAKVINFSSSKNFSLHNDWVNDALKYAKKHGVIFVGSTTNDSRNYDEKPTFPNGIGNNKILENFIMVGASSKNIDSTLLPSFSSYGKKTIDVFAPGENIPTTKAFGGYLIDSGSSMASPMVCNTIALIYSYYPTIKSNEIKNILHQSVDKYDVMIKLSTGEEISFSDMSISGGILNTYKAIKLAEKISKENK